MSNLAHAFWPRWYRALGYLDPAIGWAWRRFRFGNLVRVVLVGRRTGRERPVFLGLLRVGERRYLGHPDRACAWTLNLEAAGGGVLEHPDGTREPFAVVRLEPGPERDAVIRATFHQHVFPGGPLYWLFRANLRAVGCFYRLEAVDPG
jgi:hypothetical protein